MARPTVVTIETDLHRCAGSGMCALRAPRLFTQNQADGRVVVLREELTADDADDAFEAMEICPTGAIKCTEHPH